jgi:ubiquinone/menaquinone biosynthesis C-methylase UbiE
MEAIVETPLVHEGNADQAAYWNGPAGRRWTDRQEMQDRLLAPISELLLARAGVATGERVIDIGCGCGATAIALAERVGPGGHVLGLDLSAPMLERARQRAAPSLPLSFVLADATVHRFSPAGADLLFSRFGVMFFADPVLAFANMRKGLADGARVVFASWKEPRQNPWMMLPLQAAYRHVPRLPEMGPEDPGPFAFASEQRVRRILAAAGFSAIAIDSCPLQLDLAVGQGLEAAVRGALAMGPVSRAIENRPEAVGAVAAAIRDILAPEVRGSTVPLGACVAITTAAA